MSAKPVLHIFDLDRTITRLPTYTPFLLHAALRLSPWRLLLIPLLIPAFAAYGLKSIERARLKQIMQHMLLGGRLSRVKVERVVTSFAVATVTRNSYDAARHTISEARAAGERVVVATASHAFYASAIAQAVGATDLVATRSIWHDADMLTPKIDEQNCYGTAKLAMITAWLAREQINRDDIRIRFYSDHVSDLPVFEWCDEPVAIHPSPKLRVVAKSRNWPIRDW